MADHYQIFGASLGITNVKKWPKQGGVWRFFHVFYTDDMKCDTSVTEKTGCFGTDLSHLTYQNLEYDGCMLDTWSNVMSRNSFHHRWNDWWEETMLHRPPYHGFQLCLFIVKRTFSEQWHPLFKIQYQQVFKPFLRIEMFHAVRIIARISR